MKLSTGWQWFRSHCLPVTKQDLKEMESRLIVAIGGASDETLKRLTQELKGPTESLEAAVKENQPK